MIRARYVRWFSLVALTLCLRACGDCGGGSDDGGAGGLLPGPAARFAFVAHYSEGTLGVLAVDAATGDFRHHGYVRPATSLNAVAVHPSLPVAYASGVLPSGITGYAFDPVTGELAELAGSPVSATRGFSLVFSPAGRLYAVDGSIEAFSVDASGGLSALPGSPVVPDIAAGDVAFTSSGGFVYVTDQDDDQVHAFSVGADGTFTPLAGSPYPGGDRPQRAAVDSGGRFLFVSNLDGDSVSVYRIDPATGALTGVAGSPFATGDSPEGVTPAPDGRLIVPNRLSNSVSVFDVDPATGVLSNVAGSPFFTGVIQPIHATFDPAGRFLVLTSHLGVGSVDTFAYDAATGVPSGRRTIRMRGNPVSLAWGGAAPATWSPTFAYAAAVTSDTLTGIRPAPAGALPGSPFGGADGTSGMGADPRGRWIFLADAGLVPGVRVFWVHPSTGALSAVAGSPFAAGTVPHAAAVDPSGRFLYVPNWGSDDVSAFSIDPSTGALTSLGAPLPAGTRPWAATVDPTGLLLFVTNAISNDVSVYRIAPEDGTLTAVGGSPFASGGNNPSSVAVERTGRFAYVANGWSITAFDIDFGLIPVAGGTLTTGAQQMSLVCSPNGRFLYAAERGANRVSAYAVDADDGTLTALPASPFAAGAEPYAVAMDPSGLFLYVAERGSHTLRIFAASPSTGALTFVASIPTGTDPRSVVGLGRIQPP